MPPRLQLLHRAVVALPNCRSYQPVAPFLYPFLHQQRAASILSSLSNAPGSTHKRIRRGRGPSSGKGKTSGRGHKGQKQHGKVPAGFNGGQTPDWVVAGTRGFKNHFTVDMVNINLNKIQWFIDKGRLDPTEPITIRELHRSRCCNVGARADGVKLLARGKEELKDPIHIVVSRASAEAISAVEKAGGSVTTRYYTKFAIKRIKDGLMDPIHSLQSRINMATDSTEGAQETAEDITQERIQYRYRLPDPTSRKDLEYYRDNTRRGYLSYMVKDGQGPSLFFKTPGAGGKKGPSKTPRAKTAVKQGSENRIW